eukprot:768655_1
MKYLSSKHSSFKLLTIIIILCLILSTDAKKSKKSKTKRQRTQRQRQPKQQNCYEKLGVSTDVTDRQIKKAFRKLAMKYHPDKVKENERPEAESKFKELAHCYELLSDKDKRQKYDASGYNEEFAQQGGPGGANFHFQGNFEDIFSNFFGKGNSFGFENLFTRSGGSGGSRNGAGFGGDFGGFEGFFGGGDGPQFGFGGGGGEQQNMYGGHHQHAGRQRQRQTKKAKPEATKVYIELENVMEDTFKNVKVKNKGDV